MAVAGAAGRRATSEPRWSCSRVLCHPALDGAQRVGVGRPVPSGPSGSGTCGRTTRSWTRTPTTCRPCASTGVPPGRRAGADLRPSPRLRESPGARPQGLGQPRAFFRPEFAPASAVEQPRPASHAAAIAPTTLLTGGPPFHRLRGGTATPAVTWSSCGRRIASSCSWSSSTARSATAARLYLLLAGAAWGASFLRPHPAAPASCRRTLSAGLILAFFSRSLCRPTIALRAAWSLRPALAAVHRGDLAAASTIAFAAAGRDPDSPRPWLTYGRWLARAGHTAEAIDAYQRAELRKPDHWTPRLVLPRLLREAGRPEEADQRLRDAYQFSGTWTVAGSRGPQAAASASDGRDPAGARRLRRRARQPIAGRRLGDRTPGAAETFPTPRSPHDVTLHGSPEPSRDARCMSAGDGRASRLSCQSQPYRFVPSPYPVLIIEIRSPTGTGWTSRGKASRGPDDGGPSPVVDSAHGQRKSRWSAAATWARRSPSAWRTWRTWSSSTSSKDARDEGLDIMEATPVRGPTRDRDQRLPGHRGSDVVW